MEKFVQFRGNDTEIHLAKRHCGGSDNALGQKPVSLLDGFLLAGFDLLPHLVVHQVDLLAQLLLTVWSLQYFWIVICKSSVGVDKFLQRLGKISGFSEDLDEASLGGVELNFENIHAFDGLREMFLYFPNVIIEDVLPTI